MKSVKTPVLVLLAGVIVSILSLGVASAVAAGAPEVPPAKSSSQLTTEMQGGSFNMDRELGPALAYMTWENNNQWKITTLSVTFWAGALTAFAGFIAGIVVLSSRNQDHGSQAIQAGDLGQPTPERSTL